MQWVCVITGGIVVAIAINTAFGADTRAGVTMLRNRPGYGLAYDTLIVRSTNVDQAYDVHVVVPSHGKGGRRPSVFRRTGG